MFGAGFGYFYFLVKPPCAGNNVGVVDIMGEIDITEDPDYYSVSSLNVIQRIEELDANPDIEAVVLDIASGGGATEPSESIMLAVRKVTKPVVAIIRDVGASGAYLVATGADRIFASRLSEVGSIGVTRDFLDISEQDRQNGIIFYNFSSGKYKGAEKEHNQITQEQRDIIMEGVMKSYDIFVEYVAENRNIPIKKVKEIATGRTYLGDDALKLELIDQIGGMSEVDVYLKDIIGEEPSYCYVGE